MFYLHRHADLLPERLSGFYPPPARQPELIKRRFGNISGKLCIFFWPRSRESHKCVIVIALIIQPNGAEKDDGTRDLLASALRVTYGQAIEGAIGRTFHDPNTQARL